MSKWDYIFDHGLEMISRSAVLIARMSVNKMSFHEILVLIRYAQCHLLYIHVQLCSWARHVNFGWRLHLLTATWDFQQCGSLTWIDSDEPMQPPFKLRNFKCCSVSSFTITLNIQATSKGSDQTAHRCRLIWAFAGRTYHIVGNFMFRLPCLSSENWRDFLFTVKPVLSRHSKRRQKIGFQDRLSLNAGQKYCRMLRLH